MTVITGILIVLYCLYQLLDIDMFIKKFHGAMLEGTIDAFVFIGIIIWLVVQFFLQSAFIALIPMVFMLFHDSISPWRRKLLNIVILISLITIVSFIVLNKMYFHFNFWTLNF